MVDLSIIKDPQTFQRLVNHLFSLDCNSSNFLPFSPNIGKDGGFDAYFEGYYAKENLTGKFLIDAKWTSKNLDDACKHLVTELKSKVIPNAQRHGVDHIIIATNAELRREHVLLLHSLKPSGISSLQIWYGEKLRTKIEEHPFLRKFYFNKAHNLALIPPEVYFNRYEPDLISEIDSPTASQNYLVEFEQFMRADNERVLVVHGPGGYGKSHLLRNMAYRSHLCDRERQCWMLSDFRPFDQVIDEEIQPHNKYLIILDDADRTKTIDVLLAYAAKSGVDIKIIIGARTSGLFLLNQKIRDLKLSSNSRELSLKAWSEDNLIRLLKAVSGRSVIEDESVIVNRFPNPYFIILIGKRLAKKPLNVLGIHQDIFSSILSEAQNCLNGVLSNHITELLLLHLSCIVPFDTEQKTVLDKLSEVLCVDRLSIKTALERLLVSGILRQVGRSLRFSPDMKGDIYLLYKIKEHNAGLIREIILLWIDQFSENIFRNLGTTMMYGEENILNSIVKEFISEWSRNADRADFFDRREKLNHLRHLATHNPLETLALIKTYIELPPKKSESAFFGPRRQRYNLTADDYGPAIVGAIKSGLDPFLVRREVFNLLEKLAIKKLEGTYDNYKASTLSRDCFSPLQNPPEVILSSLALIEEWLNKPNPARLKILGAALQEVLAGTHEYTEWYEEKMVFGEKAMRCIPSIIEIRSKAMEVVKRMLSSKRSAVQIQAIEIINTIGRTRMGSVSSRDLPLAKRFVEERSIALQSIQPLIKKNAEFCLLSEIEDLLLGWWARNKDGSEEVVPLLIDFPKSPEYKIFRYFSSRMDILSDFSEIQQQAPATDRWGWLVDNVMMKKWRMQPANFSDEVLTLNDKYDDLEKLRSFLINFEKKIRQVGSHQPPLFLYRWVEVNPSIFLSLRNDKTNWRQIPKVFKRVIDVELTKAYPRHAQTIAAELLNDIPNNVDRVLTLLTVIEMYLPEAWLIWMEQLITNGNDSIRTLVVRQLYFIHKRGVDISIVRTLLLLILKYTNSPSKEFIDNISFTISSLNKELATLPDENFLMSELLRIVKNNPDLDWHDQELLKYCVSGLDTIMDFIEYRLSKSQRAKRRFRFDAIPFDGLTRLPEVIESSDDYLKLVRRSLEWKAKYGKGTAYYDCDEIIKQILRIRDRKTNELFLFRALNVLSNEKNTRGVSICVSHMPLTDETIEVFKNGLEYLISKGAYEEVKNALFQKTCPEGGWSSALGQPPPALLERRKVYESLRDRTTNQMLRNVIDQCILSIEQDIKNHVNENKERLT